jgi:hypothetical protein
LKNILGASAVIVALIAFYWIYSQREKQQTAETPQLVQPSEVVTVQTGPARPPSLCELDRAEMEKDRPGYCTRHPDFKVCTCE